MIEFYAYFSHVLYRDERTGQTLFVVESQDQRLPQRSGYSGTRCLGYTINLPKGIPLKIEGEIVGNQGGQQVIAHTIMPQTEGKAAAISFLNSKVFYGIGEKLSEKIIEKVGYQIFDFCQQEDAIGRLLEIKGMTKKVASDLVYKVRQYKKMQGLVEYLTSYGAAYSSAKKIYEKYEEESIQKIEENPYLLYFAEVSYENREAMAKKGGIASLDPRRVAAITHEAMERIEKSGNTCASFKDIMIKIAQIEKGANMGYETSSISVLAYILSRKQSFEIKEFHGKTYIYRKRMSKLEDKAAAHTIRLCREKKEIGKVCPEEIDGVSFDKDQKEAFTLLERTGISILSGGPGTGKSTVIKGFIKAYRMLRPEDEIALCAPTGAAAKRLKEVTGERATTIHKLLDVRPFGKEEMEYRDEYNQLGQSLIIVDEFSMVDMELYTMLCSAIKTGSLLLLVGDENQLPSVGAGNVLKELLNNPLIEVRKLTKVHRQKGNSTILENSIKIKEGKINLKTDKTFIIDRVSSSDEMEKLALKYMEKAIKQKNKFKIKLYSPVKKRDYKVSTYNLNSKAHQMAGYNKKDYFIYNGVTFSVGDPVIMLQNNYKKGYLNGDEAIITTIFRKKDEISVEITMLDGRVVLLKERELLDIDLGYCITIHKSQGNESDAGIILIPKRPHNLLERSLIYVAVTRAKKQNIIISEEDALEKAIRKNRITERKTNLTNRVKKELEG